MVQNSVIETKHPSSYRNGNHANNHVVGDPPPYLPKGRLSRMSVDALRYAENLHATSSATLADRLYRYGSLPVSPRWHRQCMTSSCSENSPTDKDLDSFDSPIDALEFAGRVSYSDRWINWFPNWEIAQPDPQRSVYKLYISPTAEFFHECLQTIARLLTPSGPFALKAANSLRTLARPDKVVIYFTRLERLCFYGERVAEELHGIPVQGVPFTAELFGDGLISWAIDPPRALVEPNRPNVVSSWRSWVTSRLASSLWIARNAPKSVTPAWRFALERLRQDGVDPKSWTLWKLPWRIPVES